jgi:hypothetical protein
MIQSHISESLAGLDKGLIEKYQLIPYENCIGEIVFMGMYREEDLMMLATHLGTSTIVWFGSDAKDLPEDWIKFVQISRNIAVSHQVQETLAAKGVDSIWCPINAVIPHEWPVVPNGDKIFWYSGNAPEYYGESLINEIKERINIPIIRAGHDTFTKEQLKDVYSQCFLNLRLTPHDGCPNTNIEMGLMGRRSIYNGDLPGSIPWQSVDDICQSIMREYLSRNVENAYISKIYHNFVNYERMSTLFI